MNSNLKPYFNEQGQILPEIGLSIEGDMGDFLKRLSITTVFEFPAELQAHPIDGRTTKFMLIEIANVILKRYSTSANA